MKRQVYHLQGAHENCSDGRAPELLRLPTHGPGPGAGWTPYGSQQAALVVSVPSSNPGVPSKAAAPSAAHEEQGVQQRPVRPPGQKCLDMATSPRGSGGDVDTPLARRLLLGLTDPILLVQLVPFKLAQSFGLAGETSRSKTHQKRPV